MLPPNTKYPKPFIRFAGLPRERVWNNKDPFYDRDLENFKRLHADGVISVGGIITRGTSMQTSMGTSIASCALANSLKLFDDFASCHVAPAFVHRVEVRQFETCAQLEYWKVIRYLGFFLEQFRRFLVSKMVCKIALHPSQPRLAYS